jgi:uncharacterized protein YaaN involved in tellurite resistance
MSEIEKNNSNNPELSPAQVDAALEQAQAAVAEAQAASAPSVTPEGIRLTLDAQKPAPEVAQAISEPAKAVPSQEEIREVFTPDEEAIIREFSQKIDVTDSNLVFAYGASAQQQIASFSDSALKNVKTKDLGEVGDMIAGLVTELRNFTVDEKESGFFAFFKRNIDKLTMLKNRYDEAEINIGKIVSGLEQHQVQLLKDIATLDQLYAENLRYFKELSMYIAAGRMRVKQFRDAELAAARQKAQASGLPEDAQAANDMASQADRFEKKIHDLELTRNISLQMAPQIRLLQNSNQLMAEKIQSSLVNTIPLWKSQMVLALGLQHTQDAMEAQRAVTDLTNQLLRQNAESLHQATIETAKESERGIVDIETLKQTNQKLIETMDEVLVIQKDGREKRAQAEASLAEMERQLKAKLLETND